MRNFKHLCMLLVAILMSACAKDELILTGNILGKVTDSSTGEFLQGATVMIVPGGDSRTTGSDGHFEFRDLEANQYEILATKDDYVSNNKMVTVVSGRDVQGDIQLTPIVQEGKLELSVNTLNFGSQNSSLSFNILNKGNKAFGWSISGLEKVNWLEVNPVNGTLAAGKSNAVTVTLLRDHITEHMETTLIVNSDNESLPLKITADVENKNSKLTLSSSTLNFGTEYSSLTFDVKNEGNAGDVHWNITGIDAPWLKVTPTEGTTAMSKSSAVKVDIDREKMEVGKHTTTILVNADGQSLRLTVNVERKADRYLEVNPSALVVGTASNATLAIMSHNGPTTYQLIGAENIGWAKLNKTEGVIPAYNSADAKTIETIRLDVDRSELTAGDYNFNLIIRSDLEDYTVPVTMIVEETQSGGNTSNAEIISCNDDLEFTLQSCKISGTTATLEMKVKNIGDATQLLQILGGGNTNSYAYDDQGNKYQGQDMKVSIAGSNYTEYDCRTEIPSGVMTKISVKIYNVASNSAVFTNITINTNYGARIELRNVGIEGRSATKTPSPQTTGEVVSCSDDLEFTLIDCKVSSNYTTLDFQVKNVGAKTLLLQILGGGNTNSFAYDDQGNKYQGQDMKVSIAGSNYTEYDRTTYIPKNVMTYGSIRFSNVDINANEFANITVNTNLGNRLVFKNVKIRK